MVVAVARLRNRSNLPGGAASCLARKVGGLKASRNVAVRRAYCHVSGMGPRALGGDGELGSSLYRLLSRHMGASLTMTDRHFGHLTLDGREHAIRLLDGYADIKAGDGRPMDAAAAYRRRSRQRKQRLSRRKPKAL